MLQIPILDLTHQIFTVNLDGTRAEIDVQYNEVCDRWFMSVSVDDTCISSSMKMLSGRFLLGDCRPDEFGDFALQGTDFGRDGFNSGELILYYVTAQEVEELGIYGYS